MPARSESSGAKRKQRFIPVKVWSDNNFKKKISVSKLRRVKKCWKSWRRSVKKDSGV